MFFLKHYLSKNSFSKSIIMFIFVMIIICKGLEMNEVYEGEGLTFEDFKNENGMSFWWASDLMTMLGYSDMTSFKKVLDRTTKTFISLGINHYENIISIEREFEENKKQYDFKLSRYACYLCAMNGDTSKKEVAMAQAYFAEQTRLMEIAVQDQEQIDRVSIRGEIADGFTSLASTAKKAGVEDHAKFHNAGYIGMYNMMNYKLAERRGVDKSKLLEHMGRAELAANLFRITQTEERIKSKNIRGQSDLEKTHEKVGREVRNMVISNTGVAPEDLPVEKRLPEVKKELKAGYRRMSKADKPKIQNSKNKPKPS